jgi:hypothetical protein
VVRGGDGTGSAAEEGDTGGNGAAVFASLAGNEGVGLRAIFSEISSIARRSRSRFCTAPLMSCVRSSARDGSGGGSNFGRGDAASKWDSARANVSPSAH